MPQKCGFRVIHASGQDENFKAADLNQHHPTARGWQSSRFCLYPQDIVIQLDRKTRIRKIQLLSHQFLIATKIEFYVGDIPDDVPLSLQNARYTRLGYVALSGNEKTSFKARELKSVHVDAVGVYVKLVIHKNHINKHNLYNQVGIIAINVIGDPVKSPLDNDYNDPEDNRLAEDPALAGMYNRPDYISPLDDLAFDMYQDPEVAQIIRKLEQKKQEAVLQERFDYAKKLKTAIEELQKVGEKLGKYEVEKRQAVENEDYDKAKLKKVQMDEYRLQVYKQLDVHDLLEVSGPRHPQTIDLEPTRQPTPPRLTELPQNNNLPRSGSPPRTPYDDRPLPAIKNRSNQNASPKPSTPLPESRPSSHTKLLPKKGFVAEKNIHSEERTLPVSKPVEPPVEQVSPRTPTPYDDRILPAMKGSQPPPEDEEEEEAGTVAGEPEKMSEKDMREAASAIDVFGEEVVAKAYSKTYSFREEALSEVYRLMSELPPDSPKEDARAMLRASLQLICRSIKDQVFAVFKAGLNLLKMILTEFVTKHKIPKHDTVNAVERTLPNLLQKTGDTAARNRDAAKLFVIEESSFPEVKPTHIVNHECVKPFKLTMAPRLALSRTEILDLLYKQHGLENSGLTLDNMMAFCTNAIQHNSGDVREKAEQIIISLYRQQGAPVKDYLPPDDEKTRKNVLYKKLFETFDKIDGKPSKDDIKKQKLDAELAKQKEIQDLQAQLAALKEMTAGKAPVDSGTKDGTKGKMAKNAESKKKQGKKNKTNKSDNKPAEEDALATTIDNTCIFCGEKNEAFTEEGLDLHYWKSCPMLKRCSHCKQVVEIAGLTEHLLSECDAKADFHKCPRCTEAIPKADWPQHDKEKSCNVAAANKNHCPLCHQNIPEGEEGFKNHLMGKDGCKQNPRRLQALNKGKGIPKPAGKARAGASKTPGKR